MQRSGSVSQQYQLQRQINGEAGLERWQGSYGGQDVIVKFFSPFSGAERQAWENWQTQLKLLQSRGVPPCMILPIDTGMEGNQAYVVYPFYAASSLSSRKGTFGESQLAMLLWEMSTALLSLHQQWSPVVHHSVISANIFERPQGGYALLDFGLTASLRLQKGPIHPDFQAKMAYLAPEYFDKQQTVGTAADIFSLGVSLYELASGSLPFKGMGGQRLLAGPDDLPVIEGFSPRFHQVLQLMVARGADRRPSAETLHRLADIYIKEQEWKSVAGMAFSATQHGSSSSARKARNTSPPIVVSPPVVAPVKTTATTVVKAAVTPAKNPEPAALTTKKSRNLRWTGLAILLLLLVSTGTWWLRSSETSGSSIPMATQLKELLETREQFEQLITKLSEKQALNASSQTFLRLAEMQLSSMDMELNEHLYFYGSGVRQVSGWKSAPSGEWIHESMNKLHRNIENLQLLQ